MKHKITAPSVGESVTEVGILKWAKSEGAQVASGDLLVELESDKATVEIVAEHAGLLHIGLLAGERITIGTEMGWIDDDAQAQTTTSKLATPALAVAAPVSGGQQPGPGTRKIIQEMGLTPDQALSQRGVGSGKDGRLTPGDLAQAKASLAVSPPASTPATSSAPGSSAVLAEKKPIVAQEGQRRVPLSNLRLRIAERLVEAQRTAAILTTFNEVDMTAVMTVRAKSKEAFKAQFGVNLSFMSFFCRAVIESLKLIPEINASIDGRDIVYHDYQNLGIAVGTDRGLVVPVIAGAQLMTFGQIEQKIAGLAVKAREGKLSIQDLSAGTFTISNGGTYGSLMSTPILTPPQSGILGMHKIQERPVVVEGQIEIRPMMYLALSYDHRLIDGKGAVTFLVTLKDWLEHPEKLGSVIQVAG